MSYHLLPGFCSHRDHHVFPSSSWLHSYFQVYLFSGQVQQLPVTRKKKHCPSPGHVGMLKVSVGISCSEEKGPLLSPSRGTDFPCHGGHAGKQNLAAFPNSSWKRAESSCWLSKPILPGILSIAFTHPGFQSKKPLLGTHQYPSSFSLILFSVIHGPSLTKKHHKMRKGPGSNDEVSSLFFQIILLWTQIFLKLKAKTWFISHDYHEGLYYNDPFSSSICHKIPT